MPLSKRRCTNGVIQMAFKSVFEYKKALIDSSRKSKFKKPQFLLRLLRNLCAFCVVAPYPSSLRKAKPQNTDNQPPCAFPAIYALQPA